jgi:hypothetical protein
MLAVKVLVKSSLRLLWVRRLLLNGLRLEADFL